MNSNQIRKLCASALLTAAACMGSFVSIPIFGAKAAPLQHMVNVISAVLLGPFWALLIAFCASLIRNLLSVGTFMAFPGSMIGAFLAAFLYKKTGNLHFAFAGEIFGTGILGAVAAYPIATLIMNREAAIFTYVIPFLISSATGALIALVIIVALDKTEMLNKIKHELQGM